MHRTTLIIGATIILSGCGHNGHAPIASQSTSAAPAAVNDSKFATPPMSATLVAEETHVVGVGMMLTTESPSRNFMTSFEDDGDSAYFYALPKMTSGFKGPLDVLHVYDVTDDDPDWNNPSIVRIVWSTDGLKSALLINGYPHAVFDFEAQRGYCRTGLPSPDNNWTNHSHDWDDAAIDLFK